MTSTLGIKKIQHPNGTNIATLDSSGSIAFAGASTVAGTLGVTGVLAGTSLDISGDIDIDGTSNLDVVDIDGAVDMASTLTVGGNTTLNGKFLIDGSNNDLMTFRTTGDTASQVLGLQFQNNSEAVTAQIFGTGDNSTNGVFRIKGIGSIELHGGDVGVTGDATKMMKIDANGVAQFRSSGISAGNQVFQVIDDGATLFQIRAEDGNISFPQAGAGIYLGVTSGNAANLLNDYEEGTWQPNFTNMNSGLTNGTYTKIGNLVICNFELQAAGTNSSVNITGVPFAISMGSGVRAGGLITYQNRNSTEVWTVIPVSSTAFNLYHGAASRTITGTESAIGTFSYFTTA